MTKTNANRTGHFKMPVSAKSLRERLSNRDQASLNIFYSGYTDDLLKNANSFSTYSNFGGIRNVVLSDSSEISISGKTKSRKSVTKGKY